MAKVDPLKPTASVLCKLGSIAVHVDEMFGITGHDLDRAALGSTKTLKSITI